MPIMQSCLCIHIETANLTVSGFGSEARSFDATYVASEGVEESPVLMPCKILVELMIPYHASSSLLYLYRQLKSALC